MFVKNFFAGYEKQSHPRNLPNHSIKFIYYLFNDKKTFLEVSSYDVPDRENVCLIQSKIDWEGIFAQLVGCNDMYDITIKLLSSQEMLPLITADCKGVRKLAADYITNYHNIENFMLKTYPIYKLSSMYFEYNEQDPLAWGGRSVFGYGYDFWYTRCSLHEYEKVIDPRKSA